VVSLVIAFFVCVTIGLLGVAIVRGVPAGSFVLGILLWLFGLAVAATGFAGAVGVVMLIARLIVR
jgi:hypothetical protein